MQHHKVAVISSGCEVVISGTHAVTADDEPAIAAFSAPIKRK
jgi:hypothetical protein